MTNSMCAVVKKHKVARPQVGIMRVGISGEDTWLLYSDLAVNLSLETKPDLC